MKEVYKILSLIAVLIVFSIGFALKIGNIKIYKYYNIYNTSFVSYTTTSKYIFMVVRYDKYQGNNQYLIDYKLLVFNLKNLNEYYNKSGLGITTYENLIWFNKSKPNEVEVPKLGKKIVFDEVNKEIFVDNGELNLARCLPSGYRMFTVITMDYDYKNERYLFKIFAYDSSNKLHYVYVEVNSSGGCKVVYNWGIGQGIAIDAMVFGDNNDYYGLGGRDLYRIDSNGNLVLVKSNVINGEPGAILMTRTNKYLYIMFTLEGPYDIVYRVDINTLAVERLNLTELINSKYTCGGHPCDSSLAVRIDSTGYENVFVSLVGYWNTPNSFLVVLYDNGDYDIVDIGNNVYEVAYGKDIVARGTNVANNKMYLAVSVKEHPNLNRYLAIVELEMSEIMIDVYIEPDNILIW